MQNAAKEFFDRHAADMDKVKAQAPEAMQVVREMYQKLMKDGALTAREKELVALGMAIALRCHPCIYAHVKRSLGMGITKEQVLEVAQVAVVMQGGPGYMYMPVVTDAIEACATEG